MGDWENKDSNKAKLDKDVNNNMNEDNDPSWQKKENEKNKSDKDTYQGESQDPEEASENASQDA